MITFILDLDGTIIGDCVYQCELYKIALILAKIGIKIKINELLGEYYTEKSKLIRPNFSYFYKTMKEQFPTCQFFIYTASEKKWAELEIKLIEKELNIKFDRPILTRNECIPVEINNSSSSTTKYEYRKSINAIKKKIRYKDNENNHIFIIDDNDVYLDNKEHLLNCCLYNYKVFCNYWDYIQIKKIKNKVFLAYLQTLITQGRLNPIQKQIQMKPQIEYYAWLCNKINDINKLNKKYKKDNFWIKLTKIIIENNIQVFNNTTIQFIHKSLRLQ